MKRSSFMVWLGWIVLLLALIACGRFGSSQTIPTQERPQQTTNLSVDVNSLSNYSFDVPANSDLSLSDVSGDGRENNCTVALTSGTGANTSIAIPATGSVTFRLTAGTYKLYCGNPSVYATLRVTN